MRPVLLLAAVLALAAPAAAQQPPSQNGWTVERGPTGDRATAKFRLADSFLRAGQTDRAIALLEDLLAEDPSSYPVFAKLKEAYVAARRPDDAVRLVEERMASAGRTPPLLAELGSLHATAGDFEAADATWRQALDAAPDRATTYRTVSALMGQGRFWERARDVLLEGRERLRQPELFRAELAELHARQNAYAEALTEWAAMLAEGQAELSFVQGRVGRLLEDDGAAEAFADALDRLVRQDPLELRYRRLAAWLDAERGDYDGALAHVRAVDRLGKEAGESLFAFAEAALNAGALDAALRAYDLVLETHPEAPTAPLALLSSALLYERRGERAAEPVFAGGERVPAPSYDEALARYGRFLESHPRHRSYPLALRRLAVLQQRVFHDYAEAERLLDEVLTRFPAGPVAAQARLDLGEVALLQGDLPRARAAYARVEEGERIGEAAERARLELARLDLYEGNFDMALTRARAMNQNTATDVANDAIALKLLLAEGQGPDSLSTPLRRFAEAELLHRQRRDADALAALDDLLTSYGGHGLAAQAHVLRAEVLRALGRPEEALAVLEAVPQQFPESHLADRALFAAAELRERDLSDPEAALAAYADLLARYPGSLLAPEARTRIRRLRGDEQS